MTRGTPAASPWSGTTAARWQQAGYPGVVDKQVGVPLYVDDREAQQRLPFDEVSWNAGCGKCAGIFAVISLEICIIANGNLDKTRQYAALRGPHASPAER